VCVCVCVCVCVHIDRLLPGSNAKPSSMAVSQLITTLEQAHKVSRARARSLSLCRSLARSFSLSKVVYIETFQRTKDEARQARCRSRWTRARITHTHKSARARERMCVRARAHACVRACVRACVHACVCACATPRKKPKEHTNIQRKK